MDRNKRPQSNLVFLVDVSGSMDEPHKLPLVVDGLQLLTRELGENDRVAIVVYASSEGLVLPSTRGDEAGRNPGRPRPACRPAARRPAAPASSSPTSSPRTTSSRAAPTASSSAPTATSTSASPAPPSSQRMVEEKAKDTGVFLSVLGFGRGNLNDAMMEAIADHGNGNYHYVDNRTEARKVLVEEMTGTLVTIAKDVKIQVEFNPAQVAGYRLIGYENRMLRTEDFNDDKKDAGEIGAGHTVTALYEIVPAGKQVAVGPVDDLKYQQPADEAAARASGGSETNGSDRRDKADITRELLTLKMRYKQPDGDTSRKLEWPVTDERQSLLGRVGRLPVRRRRRRLRAALARLAVQRQPHLRGRPRAGPRRPRRRQARLSRRVRRDGPPRKELRGE